MRRNKNRKSSSRSVSFYNNISFQPFKFNLLLYRSLQHSGSCFLMMQFLASSLTHVWSIAAPSHYRQGSTFQTILVTKKHPRQRQAGSRRNFLGLLCNLCNSSCRETFNKDGSWVRRSLPPHPSRLSGWVLREALKNCFLGKIPKWGGGGLVFLNFMWNFDGHCFWP